jgi:Insertion element 4 transposase N-terminal
LSAHPAIDQRRRGAARDVVLTGEMDLGVVSRLLPPALVRQVVAECGRTERRVRALPAVLMVYFVIGLGLFSGQGYREVLRKITGGAGLGGYPVATSSALARARRRLGPEPLERIFGGLCAAAVAQRPVQACAFGRRLVLASMDGTTLQVPDTAANAAAFGEPPLVGGGYGGGQAGYPQVRLLTLIACGTRTVLAAAFGPRTTSEHALARAACAQGTVGPGMIILADRCFGGYPLVSQFFNLGADLIWRVQGRRLLPRIAEFSDGSYLSVICEPQEGRRRAMARHRGRPTGRRRPPRPAGWRSPGRCRSCRQ